jgi:DNA-binding response OmpR family regulator
MLLDLHAIGVLGVLVLDANRATSDWLATVLRQRGYDVRVAASELDALAALVGWTPDAAVIDLGASDLNGETVAKGLAELDRPPILIGILRTGSASSVPANKLALFDDLFTKAASPEAVADAIANQITTQTVRLR